MARGKRVTAPDGSRWLVRRRWSDRPLPNLRKRFQSGRKEALEEGVFEGLWGFDIDGGWVGIGLAVALLLIVFVALPLLGVALELIALVLVLGSGLVGRLVLGRPWTVEAVAEGDRQRSVRLQVKGWRRSGEAADELARGIAAAKRPRASRCPVGPSRSRRRGALPAPPRHRGSAGHAGSGRRP